MEREKRIEERRGKEEENGEGGDLGIRKAWEKNSRIRVNFN